MPVLYVPQNIAVLAQAFTLSWGVGAALPAMAAPTPAETRRLLALKDPAFQVAWRDLPEQVSEKLVAAGLVEPALWDAIVDLDGEDPMSELLETLEVLCGPLEGMTWVEAGPDVLVVATSAQRPAARHRKMLSQISEGELFFEVEDQKLENKVAEQDRTLKRLEVDIDGDAPREWKPRKVRRKLHGEATNERESAERKEREGLVGEVVALLRATGLPFARSDGIGSVLGERCCQGLGRSALKKHLRIWAQFDRYLKGHDAGPFPKDPELVLQFLSEQVANQAPRTWYQDFRRALKFVEESGEQEADQMLHTRPAVVNAIKEATREAAVLQRDKPAAGARQAPPLLVIILARIESVVVDPSQPSFVRFYAWTRLLRHWGSMRWDDSMGLRPSTLEWKCRGLCGELERTKTSGPGKKVLVLPVYISKSAYVQEEMWLGVGYELMKSEYAYERDYLLPLAREDLSGCVERRAEYTDAVYYSRALLGTLTAAPAGDEGQRSLLTDLAVRYWTEHSDRAGLTSWLAGLGVAKSERSFLGRWAIRGSADQYVRTALRVVERLQIMAATEAVRIWNGGADSLGEELTIRGLAKYLKEHGLDETRIKDQCDRLTISDYDVVPQVPARPPQTSMTMADMRDPPTSPMAEADYGESVPGTPVSRWAPSPAELGGDEPYTSETERVESDEEARGEIPPEGIPTPRMDDEDLDRLEAVDEKLVWVDVRSSLTSPDGPPVWISPWLDETVPDSPKGLSMKEILEEPLVLGESQIAQDIEREPVIDEQSKEQSADEDSSDPSSDEEERQIVEALELQEPEEEVRASGYVVAETTRGLRRLHFVGACGLVPGVHYRAYSVYGQNVPPLLKYDKACINCFGRYGPDKVEQRLKDLESGKTDSETETESSTDGSEAE